MSAGGRAELSTANGENDVDPDSNWEGFGPSSGLVPVAEDVINSNTNMEKKVSLVTGVINPKKKIQNGIGNIRRDIINVLGTVYVGVDEEDDNLPDISRNLCEEALNKIIFFNKKLIKMAA